MIELFKKFKSGSMSSVNFIVVGLLFGVFYWILESVRDVIVYNKGNIFERIFTPDPAGFWMRLLVVLLLLLFGAYVQSLKDKVYVQKVKKRVSTGMTGIIWAGLGFAGLYWVLESFRDVFLFDKGSFLECIISPDYLGFWMRILAVCILILYSLYAQSLIEKRKNAEDELKKTHAILENLINERTKELSKSNQLLKQKVDDNKIVEQEIIRVNRALKTLSECNKAMVRASEESSLLSNICDILVNVGGYRLVWVGLICQNGKKGVNPVSNASYNKEDIDIVNLTMMEHDKERCPIDRAIVTGRPYIIKDLTKNKVSGPWYNEAIKRGLLSVGSFPLSINNHTFGTLNIYGHIPDTFNKEESNLLKELADDLAFGISAMRMRDEHRKAEEEKEKIQAQLLHSQKMEAVGTLAGGVAHDFNNLLTAIQVSADLAMMEMDETEPVYKDLKEIYRVAMNAADLSRQLLMFSRKHPMKMSSLILDKIIENLQKMLYRLLGENISIQTDLEPELWTVHADRGTIEQVIVNLVVNSRDAMPDGGVLTIKTENVVLDDEYCKSSSEAKPGKYVRLSVVDDGEGIDKEIMEHIFEPFFSTKGPGQGTGLGLSVVYGIIKQHEGWIDVLSEKGKGSAFEIYLPVNTLRIEEKEEEKISLKKLQGSGKRILLVEDEKSVCEFTAKGLNRNGYVVFTAHNAREAFELFQKEEGNFDLIFSDVGLPGQSGLEFVEQIQADTPDLKLLLSSGYTDHKSQWPIIREKGFKFLQKPYALTDLLRVIKDIVH
jgi:signal transduction histidine kinase